MGVTKTIPVRSTAEMLMTLDTLPPDTLATFIGELAAAQDVRWLNAAQDHGVFRVTPDVKPETAAERPHLRSGGFQMPNALASVARSAVFNDGANLYHLGVKRNLEFQAFFGDAVTKILADAQEHGQDAYGAWLQTATELLFAACVLDHREAALAVLRVYPAAARQTLSSRHMGAVGASLTNHFAAHLATPPMEITAPLIAIKFGSHGAMDALLSLGFMWIQPLGYTKQVSVPTAHDPRKFAGEGAARRPENTALLPDFLKAGMRLPGAMLKRSLDGLKAPEGKFDELDGDRLFDAALQALQRPKNTFHDSIVEAYLAGGVFDLHPDWAIKGAAHAGNDAVIDHFRDRTPWASVLTPTALNFFRQLLNGEPGASKPDAAMQHEQTSRIMQLISRCKSDGAGELIFNEDAYSPMGAFDWIVREKRSELLGRYLEEGLDAERKYDGKNSILTLTEKHARQDIAQLVRSFRARKEAAAVLDVLQPQRLAVP